MFVCLYVCMFVCMFICLFVYLFIYLFIYLCVCFYINTISRLVFTLLLFSLVVYDLSLIKNLVLREF